jgi:hypothetical protein
MSRMLAAVISLAVLIGLAPATGDGGPMTQGGPWGTGSPWLLAGSVPGISCLGLGLALRKSTTAG